VEGDRKRRTIRRALGALACVVAVALTWPAAADPAEEAFVARFAGSWSGGGAAMPSGMTRPQRVTCRMTGQGGLAALRIAGSCRALAIFSRSIAASVAYDAVSRSYVGTYEGSRAGIARLSGRRQGDVLHLSVVWPRPVHGDPRARMTIVNRGDGALRIVVEHPFAPAAAAGGTVRSADLVLTRN
jgi:hypothetical protein